MKVLFLTKYSQLGGSSKHMVYSYLEFYEKAGIDCTVFPLFNDHYFSFRNLQHPVTLREIAPHADYFAERVITRIVHVVRSSHFDVVVFEKELLPYFPFGLEKILQRRQPKMVSLYDDAVHVGYRQHPWPIVRLMCRNKIQRVIQASHHVIVWNRHLVEFVSRYNPNVSIVNTAIDLRRYRVKRNPGKDGHIVIGWIGTPNSFQYLYSLEEVFQTLSSRYNAELHVVSSDVYKSASIRVTNRQWGLDTEVEDLCNFDIGIMPLVDDEWTRGKSAYKAVQYMGVGIPVVCSPVGIAKEIVRDGVNGFWAGSQEEWTERLAMLIENEILRREMGQKGRRMVESTYSVQAVAPSLIRILNDLA